LTGVFLAGSRSTWLLLAYKVPRQPSANRVYVWRKLKKLGAVALQDAVWVLPTSPHTREQFRWLASEIDELGGESTLWESTLLSDGQADRLIKEFTIPLEKAYREILTALKKNAPDLAALGRRYQQAQVQDYFRTDLGQKVRAALLAAEGDRES
jgi:hypothetical protein